MAKHIEVDGKTDVVKSDTIVKARYKLNPLSLKFITVLIAGLKRSDDLNQTYEFRVKEFKELMGLKRKDLYWAVKEAVKEILEKPLYIPKDEDSNSFLMLNWVASAEYKEGEGVVEFEISKKLRPYLLSVKERFLKYKLENILSLSNNYSIRLYEILKDWLEVNKRYNKKAEKVISLSDFREMLEIPKSYSAHDIKRHILDKSKKELLEKTDITFNYKEIKSGRKITHLKFTITDNPRGGGKKIEDKEKKSVTVESVVLSVPDEIRNSLKQITNELLAVIEKYISERGIEYVMSNIEYANKNAKDNYVAYLLSALRNDWAKSVREKQEMQDSVEKAKKEYEKFVGLKFTYKGKTYRVEENSIYCFDTNSAWALGDILKNWDTWQPFLEKRVAEATENISNSVQGNLIDKQKELQDGLGKLLSK